MKKALRILLAALLLAALCLALSSCGKKPAVTGRYAAVNPPTDRGEMVIEHLEFSGSRVTMSSGSTAQTVDYTMKDGKFSIHTDYGDFSYEYTLEDNGILVIDGVQYRPE